MSDPIEIDASQGEGGGQVLRTSLALSLLTGRGVVLERIRARRSKPGLRAQHLSCVEAAAIVGAAEVVGASLGSSRLEFRPRELRAVDLDLDLGTAGSTSLVAQTVIPALLRAGGPSTIRLRGGTHNPLAPPFEFLTRVYLPWLRRLGAEVEAELHSPGFYPAGGGRVSYRLQPPPRLRPFELLEPGAPAPARVEVYSARLPDHVAERELAVLREGLGPVEAEVIRPRRPRGPGNAVLVTLPSAEACEVVSAYGERRKPAERVARAALAEAQAHLARGVPVGDHGADQLLLLLAIAGGGRFRTGEPSGHTRTQLELIPRFLERPLWAEELGQGRWELGVGRPPGAA